MKEIKFRAWDKRDNFMHYEDVWIDGETGKVQLCGEYDAQDIELMQYTGLKDKKGKEIYEGDIVASFYFIEQRGEVKQHEGGEWYLDYGDQGTDSLFSELEQLSCEVIGNIYENPELLEGKK